MATSNSVPEYSLNRGQRPSDGSAVDIARWSKIVRPRTSHFIARDVRQVSRAIAALLRRETANEEGDLPIANARLLQSTVKDARGAIRSLRQEPHVEAGPTLIPRSFLAARVYLEAVNHRFDEESFADYARENFQPLLEITELWALKPMLQVALLERIAEASDIAIAIESLRTISIAKWKDLIDEISLVEGTLRNDPAGAYQRMDFESRDAYRGVVARIALGSAMPEIEVARAAVEMASEARNGEIDVKLRDRKGHVGYYLIGEGLPLLRDRVGFRAPLSTRVPEAVISGRDGFYLGGIEVLTFVVAALLLAGSGAWTSFVAVLLLLLPATQVAAEFMNNLTSFLLPPRSLPKLDFSGGIPDEFSTMVAVPTLLLSEKQVRDAVEQLEVRYLANSGPNLYFALLTDPPDSSRRVDEKDQLVTLCRGLIDDLNRKYGRNGSGPFFLFHRHRVFNPAEDAWMGWERKRGKLLDLNKLLRNEYDAFPDKAGDLSILPTIRFVITLDSDTRLPRDAARSLVGTLAHPLNRAIVDPRSNLVVAGYGILQPRVGVSVQSAARSRLARIYSGETGFDIYTRAISDVYQDLYGEGTFTGKGIYDVDAFRAALDRRFPCNTLLSHDLIEGAYARAALASDIEVIDDYPSHFSAYNRRKHRWVRGDWQILRWLLPKVPDYSGSLAPNPTSLISRWKLLDNLRRSLMDPATFLLLIAGWFWLPGSPVYWTLVSVLMLLSPIYSQVLFAMLRWIAKPSVGALREIGVNFAKGHVNVLFALVFLPHQALLALDAIVRSLVRTLITHRRLLEWETAEQAEAGAGRKTPVDRYNDLMPWIAAAIGLLLIRLRPEAVNAAAPILMLWICSRGISEWLDLPPRAPADELKPDDKEFLRSTALRTWRYFREFSSAANHWLIPDNFQETTGAIANRTSPTNLGFLLNARQAAWEFGYLSLAEFIQETAATLETMSRMTRCRGHWFNWYDINTLDPLPPRFVSTVDSGNLVASLWSLKQGCLGMRERPLFGPSAWSGLRDHVHLLREAVGTAVSDLEQTIAAAGDDPRKWLGALPQLSRQAERLRDAVPGRESEAGWWSAALCERIRALEATTAVLAPWLLPEYASLAADAAPEIGLHRVEVEAERIQALLPDTELARALKKGLSAAREKSTEMQQALAELAARADEMATEMDFTFLFDRRRSLLSVGYNADEERLLPSRYDLLASEARMACFVAIAKNDIAQEGWFHLGRAHTFTAGRAILLSWTGTMFEYLMPFLWMKSPSNTLIKHSLTAVVVAQQRFAARRHAPWGISESACSRTDANGNYQYQAFGLRSLALKSGMQDALVISPYSTFLALQVTRRAALANLGAMRRLGWLGPYGFYEAADYTAPEPAGECNLVRCWMVHHQGMSLLAAANALLDSPFSRMFHSEPQVRASELLLHERAPRAEWIEEVRRQSLLDDLATETA